MPSRTSGAPADTAPCRPPQTNLKFRYHVQEEHGEALYCVEFCKGPPPYSSYFATVGANRATVYKCCAEGPLRVVQAYTDEDALESFYCCAWSVDRSTGRPLLAFAGRRGVIKIVDVSAQRVVRALKGHGNAVNDIQFHPVDPNLLFSASKDESVRVWNTLTGVCACVFAGDGGHRDEVLSLDVHTLGNCVLTSGMDHSVKVWSLEDAAVQRAILDSYAYCPEVKMHARPFPTCSVQRPAFSTRRVHSGYVDCARWVGDLVLSKSVQNAAVLWQPDVRRRRDAARILRRYPLENCDIWFIKFALDSGLKRFAVGNTAGRLQVWDVDGPHPERGASPLASVGASPYASGHSPYGHTRTAIRSAAFSPDGRALVYVCDDASVWWYDCGAGESSGQDR
jgi:polycomb protein EED